MEKLPTISNAPLKRLVELHDIQSIAETFYRHPTSVSEWLKGDLMPAYVSVMCEALERREQERDTVFVIRTTGDTETAFMLEVLERFKISVTEVKN